MRAVAEELRRAKVEVVSRWLLSEKPLRQADLTEGGRGGEMARLDLADLKTATVCVAFSEGEGSVGRGGRHTELGIALGLGIRVILVGPREHVFHCLPGVEHFLNWEVARAAVLEDVRPTRFRQGHQPRVKVS